MLAIDQYTILASIVVTFGVEIRLFLLIVPFAYVGDIYPTPYFGISSFGYCHMIRSADCSF